jgi:hypothetical protein
MSAIDADKLFYQFRGLTTEEKQHLWSSLGGEGRYLLAERILAGGPSSPPHAGGPQSQKSKTEQPYALPAKSSRLRDRSAVKRFVVTPLVSVIVALLVVNFYPLLGSSLRGSIIELDLPKPSSPNSLQVLTATPEPTRDTTSPPVVAPEPQSQSEAEAEPAAQMSTNIGPAVRPPPQIPANVQPAARLARAQELPRKQSRQQRAAQLPEPAWSRDADSFITYLFFGRVN